jgi:hypothetical protein
MLEIIQLIAYNLLGDGYSSVSIAAGYGLYGRASIPGRSIKYSLFHSVQTCSREQLAFFPMGRRGSFPVGKAADLHLVQRSRMVELYDYFSIHLHVVVLNCLSTGTTLPFTYNFLVSYLKKEQA